jgi:hypothetical protein
MDHEGLDDRVLVELLTTARRFRLPDGTGIILGRDRSDNAALRSLKASGKCSFALTLVAPVNVPGPTAILPEVKSAEDLALAKELVCAYSRYDRLDGDIELNIGRVPRPYDREKFKVWQIC